MSLVRTIQFYGSAYGTDTVNLTASLNGVTVFNGNVTTQPTANVSIMPDDQYVLFSTEIPMFNYGDMPVSITVNSGDILVVQGTKGNYGVIPGPNDTRASTGADGFVFTTTGDTKKNVKIDDVTQTTPSPRPPEAMGSWTFFVPTYSTITFDAVIDQADAGPNPA